MWRAGGGEGGPMAGPVEGGTASGGAGTVGVLIGEVGEGCVYGH